MVERNKAAQIRGIKLSTDTSTVLRVHAHEDEDAIDNVVVASDEDRGEGEYACDVLI